MGNVLVRDLMTHEVACVNADLGTDAASQILTERRVTGAPVLDHHQRVIGVVSKTDLVDPRRVTPGSTARVVDVMTKVVYAVRAGDPAIAAINLMLTHRIHRALVVDDQGGLCGIVVPMDILRAIARGQPIVSDPWGDPDEVEFVDLRHP